MNNQRGFYWLEALIALFATSILLTAMLPAYASVSKQLSRTTMEWHLFWKMRVVSHEWKRGEYSTGRYEFDGYVVDIEERSLGPFAQEGEITFRWEGNAVPLERTLYVYKMETP